jgi:hypothetical protein
MAQEFATNRYVVVEQLIPKSDRERLFRHALQRCASGTMKPDRQVAGAPAVYGDPYMEDLLARLLPSVEKITGLRLFPTYSYLRVYQPGSVLAPHRDRAACEISVTANLGLRAPHPWPIWIEGPEGASPVTLKLGDAAVYRGIECRHWREPFVGKIAVQVFLHYVDSNGPHSGWRFDLNPIRESFCGAHLREHTPSGVVSDGRLQ